MIWDKLVTKYHSNFMQELNIAIEHKRILSLE